MHATGPSVLFVNRVFPPDRGATGRCLADLAVRMAEAGWRVTVLADGRAPVEAPRGVTLVRTGGDLREGGGLAAGYLGALRRLVARGLALPRHDLIVTMTDPPLLALAGPALAARHRAAALHWCHDLYPALLPVLGVGVPAPVHALLDRAMRTALRRYNGVLAIGRCMEARLARDGVERVTLLPNWADPQVAPVAHERNAWRREQGIGERFTVAYSGNFGLAHPMGAVIEAAGALPDVDWLLIGDGRGHARVREAVAERRLANVRLLPPQPADRLAESLSAADLHLVTMDPRALGLLVPCKAAGAMAAGRPCVFMGPEGNEAALRIVEEGCGAVLGPGDAVGLARAIRRYATDPELCTGQGRRAAEAARRWDADAAALRFLALAEAVRRRPAPHRGVVPEAAGD